MNGLLGLERVEREELLEILDFAEEFVGPDDMPVTPPDYRNALDGDAVGLLFFEPSTRTRASFELAVQRLGGWPLALDVESSSMRKGENEYDTCANLQAMGVKAFVVRHQERNVPLALADRLRVPVINAGNGSGEHPTQALLDAFTLRRALGTRDLQGVRVAIVGDIVHSRVARSDVYALRRLGAEVVLAGPPQLLPSGSTEWDATFATNRTEALRGADAVIMLRIQRERIHGDPMETADYVRDWGVDEVVHAEEMKTGAFIMHPGPVMRGVELTTAVMEGPTSLILKQAGFGVAVRQAVLLRVLKPR